jgi:hypothetical protein
VHIGKGIGTFLEHLENVNNVLSNIPKISSEILMLASMINASDIFVAIVAEVALG